MSWIFYLGYILRYYLRDNSTSTSLYVDLLSARQNGDSGATDPCRTSSAQSYHLSVVAWVLLHTFNVFFFTVIPKTQKIRVIPYQRIKTSLLCQITLICHVYCTTIKCAFHYFNFVSWKVVFNVCCKQWKAKISF